MLISARATNGLQIYWAIKQAIPPFTIFTCLGLGVFLFDRIFKVELSPSRRPSWIVVFLSIVAGLLLFPAMIWVSGALGMDVPNNAAYYTLPAERFWPYLLVTVIFTGIGQPVVEEVIFRERLLKFSRWAIGCAPAVFLVSVLFASLHYTFFLTSFIFSVLLCIQRSKVGLISCVITHSSYNFCSIIYDAL